MSRWTLAAALLASGCTYTVRFPPDLWRWDSGGASPTRDGGVVLVREIAWGCDNANAAWEVEATTDGWTLGGTLTMLRRSDAREEVHTLAVVASDPEGDWDELRAGPLPDGTPQSAYVPDENSTFDCESDADHLTFGIRIYDLDGLLTDCVVWGADPEGLSEHLSTSDPEVRGLGGCAPLG